MKRKLLALFILIFHCPCALYLVSCGSKNGDTQIEENEESKHEHSYGEWVTVTEPTCTKEGLKQQKCTCGKVVSEKILNLGHKVTNDVCTICGALPSEGLEYKLSEDGTYYIVLSIGTCTEVDIIIPSIYKEIPVTIIGDSAFYFCTSLTSVTIPNSITNIGDSAFEGCANLTSIIIPNSVMNIGSSAFGGYKDVKGDKGFTSVNYIGNIEGWCNINFGNISPFRCVEMLYINGELVTELVIPDTVTEIKSSAFSGCKSLTCVTIPDSVTSIGDSAFNYCTSLTGITIPDSVTSVGDYSFSGCTGLTSVTMGTGVTSIGDRAFSGCTRLISVTIGTGVTSIGVDSFSGCTGLTSIIIPDGVTSIAPTAFQGCKSLKSVTIPDSVTSIGLGAFNGCDNLTIYCKAESKPNGWDSRWNYSNCPVVWGYAAE